MFCNHHNQKFIGFICIDEECDNRYLCSVCKENHNELHAQSLISIGDVEKLRFESMSYSLEQKFLEYNQKLQVVIDSLEKNFQIIRKYFQNIIHEFNKEIWRRISLVKKLKEKKMFSRDFSLSLPFNFRTNNQIFEIDSIIKNFLNAKKEIKNIEQKLEISQQKYLNMSEEYLAATNNFQHSQQAVYDSLLKDDYLSIQGLSLNKVIQAPSQLSLRSMDYLHDFDKLVIGDENGQISLYDGNTFELLFSKKFHGGKITNIKYSMLKRVLISASFDRNIQIFRFEPTDSSIHLVKTLKKHHNWIWGIKIVENLNLFITSGDDPNIKIWGLQNHKLVGQISTKGKGNIRAEPEIIQRCKYQYYVAVAHCSGDIVIYDLISKNEMFSVTSKYEKPWILSLSFLKQESILVVGAGEKALEFWKLSENGICYSGNETVQGDIPRVILPINDEKQLLIASFSREFFVFDTTTKKIVAKSEVDGISQCLNFVLVPEKREIILCDHESGKIAILNY